MSTYAIGDIQGCFDEFMALLEKINFNPKTDHLLLAGDLVNRGPKSLETLRFIIKNQNAISAVLGNHDFYLLNRAFGIEQKEKQDTLDKILQAKDKIDLIEYLRHLPLIVEHKNHILTHAGLCPLWSVNQAKSYSLEVSNILQSENYILFLKNLYGNHPDLWDDNLKGYDRLRLIVNYFTRMRFCYANGQLELQSKAPPSQAPKNTYPWFEIKNPYLKDEVLLFGHWAASNGHTGKENIIGIDYGCVWGGKLMSYKIETQHTNFHK